MRLTVIGIQPSGNNDLEKPVAIRPTSETVMYPCECEECLLQTQLADCLIQTTQSGFEVTATCH